MTLADRLRSALSRGVEPGMILLTGDRDDIDLPPGDTLLPAAVLIAVTDRAEPGVILTQRTETMRKHAGQIAFPGGRIDPGEDIVTAALREAEEEIALPRDRVTVIGQADTYRTVTGFQVTPVIGVIPPDLVLHPSEAEVANVFEVPLEFLLDSGNHVEASVEWQGHERHYYEIIWNDRRIWGATAAMIVNLRRRLQWA
ncbi:MULTISPECIES: CoA pyrophosphatase [Sphingomonas]|uniref:NUDIX domain-containing protein n=1 Tax=Sphingomonas aerolata TaxID=185951 RepID=A0A2T4YSH8_9SPHN|nr:MULTISPECIES: CoA pyrophosphatase [Sphingomonas]MBP2515056.1 8-oxo-dGTP pyrophosphatase MutT (NUDIX family) [Sphingomonas sp. PvP018]RZM25849.1 MAG: CoA pyrophosphatase [Sphingomonas sp.]KQM94978.1 NUDIX hydrolase [Sphingomonas sp. Leaf226]MBB3587110.1 8-oxo-dGTP pyrophosphatase MutT (NUDIX family) [Sphingomonas sp. BK481]MDY0968395.1 CoA pyrophosphatase [Sphingomonas sp. CFBP9021]